MLNKYLFHRNYIKRDFIIYTIILVSPFTFFLYTISPENSLEWETFLFKIGSKDAEYQVDEILWILSYRFYALLMFSIWYLTCRHNWRFAILVPMLLEMNKLIGIFYDINNNFLSYNFLKSLVFSIPLILIITLLSFKLKYSTFSKSLNQKLDEEIESIMKNVSKLRNREFKELKKSLLQLRKQKANYSKKEYLVSLIKLRDSYASQKSKN